MFDIESDIEAKSLKRLLVAAGVALLLALGAGGWAIYAIANL